MKYEVKGKKEGRYEVSFAVSEKEWEEAIEKTYQKTKGKYKKEGFRQGKVPRKVIESTYGEEVFYEDAFEELFPKAYTDMLKKEKAIEPIDYPEIKWTAVSKKGIEFTTFITTMPEITLAQYKGHEVTKPKAEVSDKEIKGELAKLQEKGARFVDVTDRAIKVGDICNFDFEGSVDGKKFEGGTAKNFELEIGSGRFIPGFEEGMVGLKIGEEKDLAVKFPEDYHAMDLAGKDSIFHVVIHSIKEKQLPKLDDEFAKDVSEFETLADLKASIKAKLLEQKTKTAEYEAENKLINIIVEGSKVEVPSVMIERQLDTFVEDMAQKLAYQGMKIEDFFKFTNSSEEKYRDERREEAEKVVKTSLVVEEIIKAEKIEVTAKELDDKLEEIAKAQGKTLKELKATINPEQKNVLKNSVLSDKVIKTIVSLNTIKEV